MRFPKLFVDSPSLNFTSRQRRHSDQIRARLNNGGGFLNWTSSVAIKVAPAHSRPPSATNNATLFVTVHPDESGGNAREPSRWSVRRQQSPSRHIECH
jgi:hypothetical protein